MKIILEVLVKKKFEKIILIIAFLLIISIVNFGIAAAQAVSGETWTSKNSCEEKNLSSANLEIGDVVFINGENFDPGTYQWSITGNQGDTSCDPDQQVALAAFFVDEGGSFCFPAYTIETDDCGTYTVSFGEVTTLYQVTNPQETEEPTVEPTIEQTVEPTADPTEEPIDEPTSESTEVTPVEPTEEPTEEITEAPTEELFEELLPDSTEEPTQSPTVMQTEEPPEESTPQITEPASEEVDEESTEEMTEEVDRESTQETAEPTQEVTPSPTPTPTEDPEPDEKPGASGPSLVFIFIPVLIVLSGVGIIGNTVKKRKKNTL